MYIDAREAGGVPICATNDMHYAFKCQFFLPSLCCIHWTNTSEKHLT